jgi:signal transduction histidine kinase
MSLSYLESRDEIVMITSDITDEIEYQDKLEKQIELEVSKRTKQYEIMCHQSRLAAMGEMIDSIAHQWRQPLNSLGIIVQSLRHISSQKNIDNTLLQEIESDIMNKINYMSQTIDDFSTFFRINKDKEQFDILISIEDAIRLILVQLNNHNIKIEIEKKDIRKFEIFGFSNEFRQVILNLIHNAMMQIVSKNIVDGKIKIEIKDINNNIQIDVIDNAEGVKKEDMPKIFDPYFSTKEKGSGIGLYMSKVIIENHMNGILKVRNIKDGAKFTIMLAKE